MSSGRLRVWYRQVVALLCLRILRPFCIDRSIGEYVSLSAVGFHEAFENNPQIIFQGRKRGVKLCSRWLPNICSVIVHYLETDLWLDPRMHYWWRRIGIAEPLIECLYLLSPHTTSGYNDYKKYRISPEVQKPEGRIVVFTVLTGDYDNIKDPLFISPGVDYILFTNREIQRKVWRTVKIENAGLTDIMLSRRVKMLPQEYLPKGYDSSIYVDANVVIFGDITMLTTRLNNNCHFAVTSHSVRQTVKEEMDELVAIGKVDGAVADSIYARYRQEGFKDDYGLAECTVLIRCCNDERLDSLMKTWWEEFSTNGLGRDQISIMYSIWKQNYKEYCLLDGHVMNNQFCIAIGHREWFESISRNSWF